MTDYSDRDISMDLIDRLREISARIPKLKQDGLIKTEEGTKNALIMPFINALGYNVFDPTEVTPELVADVGIKKGEKVDYAILKDGKPIILFECKCCGVDLSLNHASQLYRYFSVTSARFGVLTDGVIYKFYSDLEEANKMDSTPFFTFDMLDIKEANVESLKRFSKPAFDEERIITAASELKYRNSIKSYIEAQLTEPSEPFVRFFVQESKAYTGRLTQAVIEGFTPITKDALRTFISDQVEKRLKTALASETASATKDQVSEAEVPPASEPVDSKVETTQDELDAYLVVKAIVREVIDVTRVKIRDTQSYCSILVDDNNRKPLCRLRFNYSTKYIGIVDEQKNEEKIPIEKVDDIYQHAEKLKAAVQQYVEHQEGAVAAKP